MLRAALLLLTGNAAGSLLLLARNLILARLIPVADYGVASTLALVTTVIEMATAFGLSQHIVQSKDGDDPRFMASVQGFQLLRGVLSGAAVFAIAGPVAAFFQVPEAAWGYRAMALVPVLNALGHMDVHRLNREMIFAPMVVSGLVPAAAALLALWPLSAAFDDWRVMLGSILVQAVVGVLASHLVARRPYQLALDRDRIVETTRFGWPILVNGVLLFLVFNGDKLIVGRELGMEALGIFAMGVTLTLTPTLVLARSAQGFFLPLLSRLDRGTPDGAVRFAHLSIVALEVSMLSGVLLLLGVVLVGDLLVHLLLGDRYASLTAILTGLAAVHALRVFKTGGAVVALAVGQAANAMVANLVRVASLPVAWALILGGAGLQAIVAVAVLAEAAGFALSLWLVRGRVGLRLGPLRWPLALTTLFIVAALVPGLPRWASSASAVLLAGAVLASMADLRRYAWRR